MSVWTRGRDRETGAPLVAALAALAVCAMFIVGTRDFPLDDAWIHLSYAKSLRLGDGLSYNPGDWETGFSSPLWVLLLALWPVGSAPVVPVQLLGALLHAGTAWLATLLTLELAQDRAREDRPVPVLAVGLLGGALVATTPTLVQSAVSGMEVSLSALLLLALTRAVFGGHVGWAGVLGALGVWARPESLFFTLVFACALALTDRDRRRASAFTVVGAAVGLGLWVLYCLVVSGYPWPNTQYVKGSGGGVAGLTYLTGEVLPWQAWLVSLTGVVLVALALRTDLRDRRFETLALAAAAVATLIAIAISRPLHPGVELYESRYFAPVAWAIPVVAALGLVGSRAMVGAVLVIPMAIATGLLTGTLRERSRELEDDTRVLHTDVARWASARLPMDSTLAVEGAGALRYLTPRTMTIIDLVGLNDREAAHLYRDRERKLCYLASRRPGYLLMPAPWLADFQDTFETREVARFHDPSYTQVRPPHPQTVLALEVVSVTPGWQTRCADLGYAPAGSAP